MFGRERFAVVLPGDERLVVQDVGEGQVRRVPAVAVGDDERGLRVQLDALEQRVEAHALPAHVEMGPFRDAADVDDPLSTREREELLPAPARPVRDQAVDLEGPLIEWRSRGRARRQHRKVGREVLAGRRALSAFVATRRTGGVVTSPDKAPGHKSIRHGHLGFALPRARIVPCWRPCKCIAIWCLAATRA